MFTIVVIVLCLLIAVGMAIFLPGSRTVTTKNRYDEISTEKVKGLRIWSLVPLALAFLVFIFSIFTIVPTREIGVVTSFGRPVKTLPNGLHAVKPWEAVHNLDGTIQTNNHVKKTKATKDLVTDGCTSIRIGNESTACVDNTIRWRIKLEAGQRLYRDYREMENITDSLVTRELKAALNEVLSNYNPLDQIKDDSKGAADLNEFSRQVTNVLRKLVGSDIEIMSVILPIIHFDLNTQRKLNSYQAQVAETKIAQQRNATNKAQAQANDALKQSVSNDPNVLVAKCFEILDDMVHAKMTPPIGFSCWQTGGATSVVVPRG
jgi:regulator of protease activity HflC (stomatin/prohibitin superfamily)